MRPLAPSALFPLPFRLVPRPLLTKTNVLLLPVFPPDLQLPVPPTSVIRVHVAPPPTSPTLAAVHKFPLLATISPFQPLVPLPHSQRNNLASASVDLDISSILSSRDTTIHHDFAQRSEYRIAYRAYSHDSCFAISALPITLKHRASPSIRGRLTDLAADYCDVPCVNLTLRITSHFVVLRSGPI